VTTSLTRVGRIQQGSGSRRDRAGVIPVCQRQHHPSGQCHGVPYYLVDPAGTGNFARQDGLGADIRPPMWVIKRF